METKENEIEMMSAVNGSVISEKELSSCKSNNDAAIECKDLGASEHLVPESTLKTVTSTGMRISPQVSDVSREISNWPEGFDAMGNGCSVKVNEGMAVGCDGIESKGSVLFDVVNSEKEHMVFDDMEVKPDVKDKGETMMGCEETVSKGSEIFSRGESDEGEVVNDPMEVEPNVTIKEESVELFGEGKSDMEDYMRVDSNVKVKKEENNESLSEKNDSFKEVPSPKKVAVKEEHFDCSAMPMAKDESNVKVEKEPAIDCEIIGEKMGGYSAMPKLAKHKNVGNNAVNMEGKEICCVQPLSARPLSDDEYNNLKNSCISRNTKQGEKSENRSLSTVVIEDGDFPEEPDWLLVGRNVVTGLSTTKGRKLENNEIVHFAFPNGDARNKGVSRFQSSKASSGIVRFSTKRHGEIGRLPMEWGKCLIPLVNSSKVKVLGRCISAPVNLQLMQEIMLYASFYIHHSVFTDGESSWRLDDPSHIDTTTYPLLTLFKLLKIKPFQEAAFTPDELNSRKRHQMFDGEGGIGVSVMPLTKRIKGVQPITETKDEQAISESTLNKLVGAADMYDLKEMEPPDSLMCDLRPYQKQALFWMTESEKCVNAEEDVEEAPKTVHPCWGSYRICDERAPAIYVNIFSGEATTKFPNATESARGGVLADAMGLGKTVMTIALILARLGKGIPKKEESNDENMADTEYIKKKRKERNTDEQAFTKAKGGTLIICPMALLGQWKDELEAHSKPGSVSVFVHYGGDRSNDPKVIAEPDVILTTYGVLSASYKSYGKNSIFHVVEWHRVVLDEAHMIKSSKALVAQSAFALSSYCRWCLTGTPLQNNLEDLYSLLCFLHVEPWCNWAWWQKFIQKPYENGDQRGLKMVKAILRPLMLRRTKETKDKEGRPILVLPPTDIKIIECEQSETEFDFYDALFKRSKVQFDQFVAQGKVLHNYANILELLLRLRQCCNHPFLVLSRGDTQQYADLNKLAARFFETNPNSISQNVPTRAYVEEVVEGIRKGENAECPICLESADDPVLTPCAHRMCRECLLSSWRTPAAGACPICRQTLTKSDLITCPSENRFRINIEEKWKESSKVSKLLECLERIRDSGSGEKSIVFSQWTCFLDLLEIPLKRKKIGYLRFDGKLVQKQREKVLKEFNETGEKMVLLMSLKAGGVGLNLTAASNVFLMDPWWNPAVEEQAIMRIHRIGQKRTVRVRRFIVKDTVEQRLQQVQAKKQRMIAGALTDEEVRSARLEELKMLFR